MMIGKLRARDDCLLIMYNNINAHARFYLLKQHLFDDDLRHAAT